MIRPVRAVHSRACPQRRRPAKSTPQCDEPLLHELHGLALVRARPVEVGDAAATEHVELRALHDGSHAQHPADGAIARGLLQIEEQSLHAGHGTRGRHRRTDTLHGAGPPLSAADTIAATHLAMHTPNSDPVTAFLQGPFGHLRGQPARFPHCCRGANPDSVAGQHPQSLHGIGKLAQMLGGPPMGRAVTDDAHALASDRSARRASSAAMSSLSNSATGTTAAAAAVWIPTRALVTRSLATVP